ncbi:unnamed protein product [Vitrella brassicaformis CCMP3155]|uniref:Uncharacterized protein n=1 Tax=Vitrella brassicaformis (strain CCMP3155) TaxID=1169540 RepID=A0A0G4GFP5_VITBC|nr:unnamed protein product [Vitrella brassicaformis CCMP3155]|eukprot:CEM28329.1 unnamed protein product [Vitrella brassicaformis CCMP3155]
MRTSDLSNVFRNQYSSDVSIQLLDGTTFSAQPNGQPELSDVSPGITLYDLQANLCYVVDELVTGEQMHQAALRRRANGSDIEKADTEASTDNQQHTGDSGGWRGLYEARKTKRTLIEAGSPPVSKSAAQMRCPRVARRRLSAQPNRGQATPTQPP